MNPLAGLEDLSEEDLEVIGEALRDFISAAEGADDAVCQECDGDFDPTDGVTPIHEDDCKIKRAHEIRARLGIELLDD